MYTELDYRNELYHHGILGQKWGKKNGPPYPLGSEDHSSSERKAGWRASLKNKTNKVDDNKTHGVHLTDKQKKVLKIGLIAAGTVLAVGGGIYLYKKGYFQNKVIMGKNAVSKNEVLKLFDNKHTIDKPVDVVLGNGSTVTIKHCTTTKAQDLEIINRGLSLTKEEINKFLEVQKSSAKEQLNYYNTKEGAALLNKIRDNVIDGNFNNCFQNSIAGVLRRMGYDVVAAKNPAGTNLEEVFNCFKNAKVQSLYKTAYNAKELKYITNLKTIVNSFKATNVIANKLESKLISQGNNSFGLLNIHRFDGNHAVEYSIENGSLKIFDNQIKKEYSKFIDFFSDNKNMNISLTTFIRLDNCEPILNYMLENHFIIPN